MQPFKQIFQLCVVESVWFSLHAYSNKTKLRLKRHLVQRLGAEGRNRLTVFVEDILRQLEDLEQLYVSGYSMHFNV